MFKTIMTVALDGAKVNMEMFGYLTHVLIAMTRKGPLISSLTWTTNAEKAHVIQKCVKKINHLGCLMYSFVGEANVRELKLDNLSGNKIQELKSDKNLETIDCIIVCGETREGQQSAIITPTFKNSSNNRITCGRSVWVNKKDQIGQWIDFKIFKGIFGEKNKSK